MLPSKVVRNKAGRAVPLLLAALIFAGCSGRGPTDNGADIKGPATGTSDYYLQQMQQSGDNSKLSWQLLAIRALLNEGKTEQAKQLLDKLPSQRDADQQQEVLLLGAHYYVLTKDLKGASALLNQVTRDQLSKDQLARYYQLIIAAQHDTPSLQLIRAYIAQQPLLSTPQDKQKNIDATWQALTGLSKAQRDSLVINADENVLQGWLDLLNTYSANQSQPDQLKSGIRDWQTRYPDNPAAKMLPGALSGVQNFQPASTGKIALLLPLSGQARVFANAIEKGFDDARNGTLVTAASEPLQQAQAQSGAGQDTQQSAGQTQADAAQQDAAQSSSLPPQGSENNPIVAPEDAALQPDNEAKPAEASPSAAPAQNNDTAPPSSAAQVQLYDTSSQPLDQVIARAQQDGATLIVGPLLKNNVDKLATLPTAVNILALNKPEQLQNRANICYFALSPEDEARDAAQHIWDQGKRQPLLLLPRSALGDRISRAFAQRWQQLGGATVLQQRFGSVAELKQEINSGAGIRLSGTAVDMPAQAPQQVTIAGLTIPAPESDSPANVATTEGNPDAVYVIATQNEMQLIKPMIAMRISSRDNIAIYASSRSNQAGDGADFRFEMEGLQFSDAPLLTGANPPLLAQAARNFNNDYSLIRLYAMGTDAWTLANHFSEMRQNPAFQIKGNTGVLSASQDCVINRKLTWSQYRQGRIVAVN
ncbi:penicillin-binding protein activator [Erwinia sp. OLTSP20]|uniref:penicillin-binding protein activator n=1 Tax=unclassified Erwinia TaxID=2622719 RepID=UPI000C19ED93|nr:MULTISPECIES: penicillin-binding protein activator [unclassified Erwinia]PIJ52103.1 penicillin-binding protein activator [Erwinia sp. OAMSP11]PIJ75191.1 penicillin-binding protein activator [Erwinia sp. OLSSP12]PIJ84471.1 penicillin-binding protein activator [Erwinia sp. OLCASP19]PIJ87012.1 penicillin-binding protein activator [Erwinia sp. OLMTSP26]PIJ88648.1 penicillin-binding protein activator [Erwinia sp. OLMDSP33]